MPADVVVTGATGFLGGAVARALAGRGFDVIGTGRDPRRGLRLTRAGVRFAPIDLADRASLARVLHHAESVVHCAALSVAWAPRDRFWKANVTGTRNLIDACRRGSVRRLVHISTPAVLSAFRDQFDLPEHLPLPATHTSEYGRTKAEAERLIGEIDDLETATLRPKAIYGPGDTTLLPRLVSAARAGRLPVIGDRSTMTHLTHVDDAVRGVVCALAAPSVSGAYHIAGPRVNLWEAIDAVLAAAGIEPPARAISVHRAVAIGGSLEWLWRTFRLRGEPPLTRYTAAVLGFSQTLDTRRAFGELGFRAEVEPRAGLETVREELRAAPAQPPKPARHPSFPDRISGVADVRMIRTGSVRPPRLAVGAFGTKRIEFPVSVGIVRTLAGGTVLFDSGYGGLGGPHRRLPWRFYRTLLRPRSGPTSDSLERAGIRPTDVDTVVVSHLDPDHTGGLREFPTARIVMDIDAWDELRTRRGPWWRRDRERLPCDLAARVDLIDTSSGPVDVTGDHALYAIALPGHAPGHIGLVLERLDRRFVLCGDAILTLHTPNPWPRRLIASNRRRARHTVNVLLAERRERGWVLLASHDPEAHHTDRPPPGSPVDHRGTSG